MDGKKQSQKAREKCALCAENINTINGTYCRKLCLLTEYSNVVPCQ